MSFFALRVPLTLNPKGGSVSTSGSDRSLFDKPKLLSNKVPLEAKGNNEESVEKTNGT